MLIQGIAYFVSRMNRTRYIQLWCAVFVLTMVACKNEAPEDNFLQTPQLVKAEGKDPMILLTDRPPNLETPLHYFLQDFTPNEVFFVRWHLPVLPPKVDEDTFHLFVAGHVDRPLSLTLADLRNKFTADSIVALAACAGNARSFCDPQVPGGQWKNGAMGNANWKGVKLKDLLQAADVKTGAVDVAFNGLDLSSFESVPDFEKSISISHALQDQVIVAYEMNGEPLPYLNGYPLKLVVPGWYATYWVGMLQTITVLQDTFDGYWMKKAYLVPRNNENANEKPDSLSTKMEPISRMDVRSVFIAPEPDSILHTGKAYEINGLAFDDGAGIEKVEISMDKGASWTLAKLDPEIGKYAWRRWRYDYTPTNKGEVTFMVKATNREGRTQPLQHWNRSGYMRNQIEELTLKIQ